MNMDAYSQQWSCAKAGRGYFGIGIEGCKTAANLGTLWRTAYTFGAAFVFTVGARFHREPSDTVKSWRHLPVFHYPDMDVLLNQAPSEARVIGIEMDERAVPLGAFGHPQRAIYLLGAEDHGLSKSTLERCHGLVQLPGRVCLNVAVAGALVMYARHEQSQSCRKTSAA
jgi:tRNA G18 (ribose-2'-O)-methylase SpoU